MILGVIRTPIQISIQIIKYHVTRLLASNPLMKMGPHKSQPTAAAANCPFMSGALNRTAGSGFSNRDLVAQATAPSTSSGSIPNLSNPMGGGFRLRRGL